MTDFAAVLGARKRRVPVFTFALLAMLAAVYGLEVWSTPGRGLPATFSISVLVADGGSARPLIAAGQIWRLFTAPMLHSGLTHLLGNGIALLLGGIMLEQVIGWRWYAATFAVSALTGGVMSLALNNPNMVTVGASGGILGLFGAAVVLAFRLEGPARHQMLILCGRLVLPALLPSVHAGVHVDVAAHIGGLLGGLLMGTLARWAFQAPEPFPRYGRVAAATASVFFLTTTVAFGGVALKLYVVREILAPALPRSFAAVEAGAGDLLKRYPRDPRIRYAAAAALYEGDRDTEAKARLQDLLADEEALALSPETALLARTLLGEIDAAEGQTALARSIVAPVCASSDVPLRRRLAALCL